VVKGAAKGENVAPDIRMETVAAILFQGCIERGAAALDDRNGHLLRNQRLHQAKINQLEQSGWGELQVGRLYVPVDERRRLPMEIGERVGKLVCPAEHIVLSQEGVL